MSAIGGSGRTSGAGGAEWPERAGDPSREGAGTGDAANGEAPASTRALSMGLSATLLAGALSAALSGAADSFAAEGVRPPGYELLDAARAGEPLRPGARGPAVEALQRALTKAGVEVAPTGRFDDATARAVMRFQAEKGLKADGVVGPKTLAALDAALGLGAPPGGSTPAAPTGTAAPATGTAVTGEARLPAAVPARGVVPPVPPGYARAKGALPREAVAKASEVLKRMEWPIGTQVPVTIGGKEYLYVVEWHKHAPTDDVPAALKDWHRGVTVYERRP